MHRDYQGNAPIHFYQYADRLEVVNHGGLYGRARPENFPNVSDYRNPIIAEAMKVLGYVNCYNRGITEVQRELAANGNGVAEFSFRLITAFEAKVVKAGQQELDHSAQDSSMKSNLKSSLKSSLKTRDKILKVIKATPSITLPELAVQLDMSLAGIKKNIRQLQTEGSLRRIGPDKGEHWEVMDVGAE